MIKFGIFTTESKMWLHFHPFVPALYWYRVADCLEYISSMGLRPIDGRSKDGTVTGSGYLVPKDAPFIKRRLIDQSRIAGIEWNKQSMTDREAGDKGADIVIDLIRAGIISDLGNSVTILQSASAQNAGKDILINGVAADIKTERVISANLFVQESEGGHKPTLLGDGSNRYTPMTPFGHEPGFVGFDKDGHFLHYCHCGAEASFGYGVSLLRGQLGTWYCRDHRPAEPIVPPPPPQSEPPSTAQPLDTPQGELF